MNVPAQGYTVALCSATHCHTPKLADTASALRECVRSSMHGLMVTTGCLLGAVGCRLRPEGPLVVVQPCDTERRPVGPAVRVGPLVGPEDIVVLQAWIRGARLDPALLPAHLVNLDQQVRSAARN